MQFVSQLVIRTCECQILNWRLLEQRLLVQHVDFLALNAQSVYSREPADRPTVWRGLHGSQQVHNRGMGLVCHAAMPIS